MFEFNGLKIESSPLGVFVTYGDAMVLVDTPSSIDEFFENYFKEANKILKEQRKQKMEILKKIQEYGDIVKIYNEELGRIR